MTKTLGKCFIPGKLIDVTFDDEKNVSGRQNWKTQLGPQFAVPKIKQWNCL